MSSLRKATLAIALLPLTLCHNAFATPQSTPSIASTVSSLHEDGKPITLFSNTLDTSYASWKLVANTLADTIIEHTKTSDVLSIVASAPTAFNTQLEESLANELVNQKRLVTINPKNTHYTVVLRTDRITQNDEQHVILHMSMLNTKGNIVAMETKQYTINPDDIASYIPGIHHKKESCKEILTPNFYGDGISIECIK